MRQKRKEYRMDAKNEPLLRYSRRPYRRHLAAVVRTYYSFVWRCAVRLTGHREDASDLCQDVLTIVKIRQTLEECIQPSPSRSRGKRAPHPAVLREDSVPEILSWLGFPPYGQLKPKDQEAIWALIDEYRATYRELEDERADLVARIIEHKSQAGEYYKGEAFRKICFDPRFVERPEEVRPIPVDGEQVYVCCRQTFVSYMAGNSYLQLFFRLRPCHFFGMFFLNSANGITKLF